MTQSRHSRPIGVFDSGAGGLTVLSALRARLPRRDFLYFADTCRVPYGRKPQHVVARYAEEISTYLVEAGVGGIVIACNTASAASLPGLARRQPVPVWGVIEPGVEAAGRATRTGSVGVIGATGSIRSGAYQMRLEARGLRVWARACPMLVHLVEEGLAASAETEILVRHYLADRPPVDTLILGCTHYPHLRHAIERAAGPAVRLVDSAAAAADLVAAEAPAGGGQGDVRYVVTGDPEAFLDTARALGTDIASCEQLPIGRLFRRERVA